MQERHPGGEGPTVIRLAGVVSVDLIGTELVGVDALVGDGSGIAQVGVLAQVRLNHAQNRVADGLVLSQYLQYAVLDLLDGVRDSIRPVHFNGAADLVYGEFVPLQVKLLVRQG